MPRNKPLQSDELDPAAAGNLGEHQSVETLNAYYRRALAGPTAARVRRHLVLCPHCRDLLLDLAHFLEDQQGPHYHSAAEVEAAWEKLLATRKETQPRPTKTAGA
jgi:anti-sigma factor ChrR (cupin superfamily)